MMPLGPQAVSDDKIGKSLKKWREDIFFDQTHTIQAFILTQFCRINQVQKWVESKIATNLVLRLMTKIPVLEGMHVISERLWMGKSSWTPHVNLSKITIIFLSLCLFEFLFVCRFLFVVIFYFMLELLMPSPRWHLIVSRHNKVQEY